MATDGCAWRVRRRYADVEATFVIDSIAAGGDGVGRVEGMVAFVPRTAPQDRIRAQLSVKGRLARGTLVDVLDPSPQRITPPCPHYVNDRCGGCQLQHLAYAAQLDAKATIIRDSLQRIGKQTIANAPPVEASDREWRYRTKLTLAIRRDGDGWIAGLHPFDDPVAVFPLVDCPITDERVMVTWREVLHAATHFPFARELRGSVRLLPHGAAVTMEGGTKWPQADAFFAAVPSAVALWWQPDESRRRLVGQRGAPSAGASFGQINAGVAAALAQHVVDLAKRHEPRSVIDAYAGVGNTAVALAQGDVRVTAIELDREAVELAAKRLPPGSKALAGRVEDMLPRALPADVVILNPPRAGVHDRVTAQLQQLARPPRGIVYVSCNPATLARDLARMPRYRIASLRGFDMFPQTAHVETVCELVPQERAA